MKIEIINNNASLIDLYSELGNISGTIFNSKEWLEIFRKEILVFGIFDNNSQLIGGFQLSKQVKFGIFSFTRNPLYQPHIALFFQSKAKNEAKKNSETHSIIQLIADFIKSNGAIISIAFPPEIIDLLPFYNAKFKIVPNYTYQINLNIAENDIFSMFSPERRNDINRAEKDGLICKQETNYNLVYEIVNQTFSVKGDGLYPNQVKKILFQFANENNSCAFITYSDNLPIAACFVIYNKNRAYYLLGGYSRNQRHGGAGALAVWKAIQFIKSKEVAYFDFEGSMIPEVEKYFRGFGGQMVPYCTVNKAILLLEMGLKFFKRTQF